MSYKPDDPNEIGFGQLREDPAKVGGLLVVLVRDGQVIGRHQLHHRQEDAELQILQFAIWKRNSDFEKLLRPKIDDNVQPKASRVVIQRINDQILF